MNQKPKIVVGTLTRNQKERLVRCLDSLSKLDYPNFTLGVVDNHSTDGTVEILRERYPQVSYLRHRENLGFGEGINSQIRLAIEAGADYLFTVENDVEADPRALSLLVEACEKDPKIGAAFPAVYYSEERNRVWPVRGTSLKDIREEIARSPLGICLIRMEAVKKVGYLDPDYFVFFDDADWLLRLERAGYVACDVPEARAWHGPPNSASEDSAGRTYYQTRNRLYFFRKYSPPGYFLLFFLFFLVETFFWKVPRHFFRGKPRAIQGRVWAWVDFLKGKRRNREFSEISGNVLVRMGRRVLDFASSAKRKIRFWWKRAAGKPVRIRVRVDWNIGD